MTVNDWGNVYWKFFHTSSILIQHAFGVGRLSNFLKYPSLLYNVDIILPCGICIEHYKTIKKSPTNDTIIRNMSFGDLVGGTFRFHNLINSNRGDGGTDFRALNFATTYHCFIVSPYSELKFNVYDSFVKKTNNVLRPGTRETNRVNMSAVQYKIRGNVGFPYQILRYVHGHTGCHG